MFDDLKREIYASGQTIFETGDVGDCAYLVEEGTVEIVVLDQNKECRIGLMGKGEMIGEASLIEGSTRTATARAVERTVLVPFTRELMDKLLKNCDPILRHLLLIILNRFRSSRNNTQDVEKDVEAPGLNASHRSVFKGEETQKISLIHGMTRALESDEFQLHYQPICNISDGQIAGFEALIRWNHPIDGLMEPKDFLWLAEQTGQIQEIGLWTIERACRDWPTLKQLTESDEPFISVNLSMAQLENETLAEDVLSILLKNNMAPAELKLELTETVIVSHPEIAKKIFKRLIEVGSSLALDNYGTSTSVLKQSQKYPIATMKIDRGFVANILQSPQNLEIVRSSITLAHSLDMDVIAEGIENSEVKDRLIELGCGLGQGWYFGRPSTLHDLVIRYTKTDALENIQ